MTHHSESRLQFCVYCVYWEVIESGWPRFLLLLLVGCLCCLSLSAFVVNYAHCGLHASRLFLPPFVFVFVVVRRFHSVPLSSFLFSLFPSFSFSLSFLSLFYHLSPSCARSPSFFSVPLSFLFSLSPLPSLSSPSLSLYPSHKRTHTHTITVSCSCQTLTDPHTDIDTGTSGAHEMTLEAPNARVKAKWLNALTQDFSSLQGFNSNCAELVVCRERGKRTQNAIQLL